MMKATNEEWLAAVGAVSVLLERVRQAHIEACRNGDDAGERAFARACAVIKRAHRAMSWNVGYIVSPDVVTEYGWEDYVCEQLAAAYAALPAANVDVDDDAYPPLPVVFAGVVGVAA